MFCTLHPNSKSANILKRHFEGIAFRGLFSYSKAAQY